MSTLNYVCLYFFRKSSTSPAPSVPSRKVSCDIAEMSAGANTSGAPLHYIQVASSYVPNMEHPKNIKKNSILD